MPRKSIQALIAFSTCMAFFGTVQAATFSVDNLNDSGAGTLRAAIVSANDNPGPDAIEFNAGLNGTIVLSSDLPELTGDVEITGPGAEIIAISGQSLYRPFFVSSESTVTLTGLTIANGQTLLVGSGGKGGGIHNEGNLTVTDCVLSNNHAEFDGGAIRNFGGSLLVSQSTLSGNTAGEFGVGAGISNAGADLHTSRKILLTLLRGQIIFSFIEVPEFERSQAVRDLGILIRSSLRRSVLR